MICKNTTQEQRKARRLYMRKWRAEHTEKCQSYQRKWRERHREEYNARINQWRADHKEQLRNKRFKEVNSNGVTKHRIRTQSNYFFSKTHTKISGYEIHHCFGYEDYKKFIYIPKKLHQEIHKQLRENNISADTDHWLAIRDLVNSCDQYTYISV